VLDGAELYCSNCQATTADMEHYTEHVGWLYAPFAYESEVAGVVHRFKYGGARALAKPMAQAICTHFPDIYGDFLVPVPLHPNRLRQRGFNQAAHLAMELSEILNLPVFDGLERLRETAKQFDLAREQRMTNLAGAMGIKTGFDVAEKHILLVDDIFTTGATANDCARALLEAGAKQVDMIAFARA